MCDNFIDIYIYIYIIFLYLLYWKTNGAKVFLKCVALYNCHLCIRRNVVIIIIIITQLPKLNHCWMLNDGKKNKSKGVSTSFHSLNYFFITFIKWLKDLNGLHFCKHKSIYIRHFIIYLDFVNLISQTPS